jgi:hypothetical protein
MTDEITEMKLQKSITRNENDIIDRIKRGKEISDSKYCVLANDYNKLFMLNKDINTFNSSIDNINTAIRLSPYDLKYYATRAKFYMHVDKYDVAKEDIDIIRGKINKLSGIEKMYCEKIINDFDKVSS